ncbi:SUKH-4 family immunity protein [Streptomyces sp. NPDC001930]|uniref:SUKH-4 family immunity protein n=1 Tax=Streptomyces sp. NPDC001930 TaxID=3364625 RepID=UPI00368E3A4B
MLTNINSSDVVDTFGLTAITYFPHVQGAHLGRSTANFLATVGLPGNTFFSPRLDLEDESLTRLAFGASVKASFERDGATCPPEAVSWEELGGFQYAMVAVDPTDGRIYAFSEGEVDHRPMHADVSSLVHSLTVLEKGKAHYTGIARDDDESRDRVVEHMRQEIAIVDATPFADDEGEWPRLFDEINLGMWG